MVISPPRKFAYFCGLAAIFISISQQATAQEPAGTNLLLISPLPGSVAVSKSPKISFRSGQPLLADGRLILLDGNDITALVTEENDIYSFTPLTPMNAGEHSLYVAAYSESGELIENEFYFSSRQSESFEEIYSDNHVSATLKTALARDFSPDDNSAESGIDFPYTSLDSYLSSESAVREGSWDTSLRANIRYFDQNAAVMEPEKKWLSLLDFLVSANYTAENYSAFVELGDTSIEESKNTIDYLTRRGGKARISAGNMTLNGFGVLGSETGYEIEGLGLGFNSNDHIMGSSLQLDFFEQKLSLKGIYAHGGEEGNSFGSWSQYSGRKGDVTGIVLTSDFFNQTLTTDFEFDTVNYDHDTGDEEDEVYDKAYRIRIGGLIEAYDYDLSYTYNGPQYDVVGNQSIVKDWAGLHFSGGTTYPFHAVRLLLDYSWDNVEDNDLFARIYSFTSGLEYHYSGWDRFPASLLFEHNNQRSADEPVDSDITTTSLDTNSLSGTIGYTDGPWAIELRSSYSEQNDKTANDYDSRLLTVAIVPTYTNDLFSVMPSWTLNTSKDLASDTRTDSNTLTLDIYSSFYQQRVGCEAGGTYDWTKTDDDSIDSNNTAVYARLNYRLDRLWRLEDSTIGLEYIYNRYEDRIYDSTGWDGVLTLVLSSSIPYSL